MRKHCKFGTQWRSASRVASSTTRKGKPTEATRGICIFVRMSLVLRERQAATFSGLTSVRQDNASGTRSSAPMAASFSLISLTGTSPADERFTVRKEKTVPLMRSLYDWIEVQMTVLSRHSDTAKAFAYLLKQWEALNLYCSNGWAEIDNNIAEIALRSVALGRKNWLFAGSDGGGERAAVLYSLIGTCRLNGVDPEGWLSYVLGNIQEWPVNRLRTLLPWNAGVTCD